MKKISRKKRDLSELGGSEQIRCYLGIGNGLSQGVITASEAHRGYIWVLEEVTILTKKFMILRDVKTGRSLEKNLDNIISHLLSELFENLLISPSDIDYYWTYLDPVLELNTPADIIPIIRKLEALCGSKMSGKSVNIIPEAPIIASNEIKYRMVFSGITKMIEMNGLDFTPEVILDISSITTGFTVSDEDLNSITGFITGFGRDILDALEKNKDNLELDVDLDYGDSQGKVRVYDKEVRNFSSKISDMIAVNRAPSGTKKIGGIPVNVEESYKQNVKLIGCTVREDEKGLERIADIGKKAASYGIATLNELTDAIFARLIGKIIKCLYEEELINRNSIVCISYGDVISDRRAKVTLHHLEDMGFANLAEKTIFVDNPESLWEFLS